MAALAEKWTAIGKPGRQSVGAVEWERIKGMCVIGDAIEGEAQEVSND